MTERCDDLDLFFDQELEAEAAQAFRDHLATCARCQSVLRGRMLEAAVLEGAEAGLTSAAPVPAQVLRVPVAAPEGAATPPPRAPEAGSTKPPDELGARGRRSLIAATAAIMSAAAALLMMCPRHPEPAALALGLARERSVEVRFSAPALDGFRPLEVMRAADAPHTERIKLQELSELERRGELNALAGAQALNGDLVSAEHTAAELPRTAWSLSDRAAIELLRGGRGMDRGGRPTQDTAAERALSLSTEALRIDPTCVQARWNRALALGMLGLSLTAARAFDEVAGIREAGWSTEARTDAEQLRGGEQRRAGAWKQLTDDANRMVLGGPVLDDGAVSAAPSLARDAFYQALAIASTPARLDQLVPLARRLDARFATTALGDLLARVRASDLRSRTSLAAELEAFIKLHKPPQAINELRTRALAHDVRDLVLASFLAVDAAGTDDDDLALLDRLANQDRDPWWRLVELARRAYVAEFWHRDYPAVDAVERRAAAICKTIESAWCVRIALFAGGANSQMGRADLAIEQITAARQQAKSSATWDAELAAIDALGQAISIRVADDVDSSAIAGAYLDEAALRKATCTTRLHRLDFAAAAALQHHRFAEAAGFRDDADALERGECAGAGLRLNGETARLRLLLHGLGRVETLRANVARLASEGWSNMGLYLEFLGAAAMLVEDRSRGEAALHQVIAAASADLRRTYAPLVRASAFDLLVESAAGAGNASAVLALLTERLGAPRFDRCVLGVASWNRLAVAVLGPDGTPALELRDIPEGEVMIPPASVVSRAMRARLAGCRRIEVVTAGPYFGAPRLLGDDVAWVYHTGHAGHAGPPRTSQRVEAPNELVVSDVSPPETLHLPALQRFSGGAGARLLSGQDATPERVLAEMTAAGLIVIVAHGFTDASEPTAASLILSPNPQGDYLLTASKVSAATLTGSPVVVLAGCDAGRVQVSAEPWSLATSFLAAGARVVIAPTEPIPDRSANAVFGSLVDRIRAGTDPVDALAIERRAHSAMAPWLSSIVVFE